MRVVCEIVECNNRKRRRNIDIDLHSAKSNKLFHMQRIYLIKSAHTKSPYYKDLPLIGT